MKERPIIFSAATSVRAILAGTKTQTRRVMRVQPTTEPLPRDEWNCGPRGNPCPAHMFPFRRPDDEHSHYAFACPYGAPGDRLWVREGYHLDATEEEARAVHEDAMDALPLLFYRAEQEIENPDAGWRWRSPMFMPRWASRLLLEVTAVRVQRLQDISERDACAEGMGSPITRDCKRPKFAKAWDAINGERRIRVYNGELGTRRYGQKVSVIDRSHSWASNPWVWAVSFRRVDVPESAACAAGRRG